MSNETNAPGAKVVLQKFIASSGYCSRRQAQELIRNGAVLVNGQNPKLGDRVDSSDEVTIEGEKIIPSDEKVYIILNKPTGYTCTTRNFKDEMNVFELIENANAGQLGELNLHIVGRLDKNSRGLVLLTNDGELTQKLTHPKYEHEKEYLVTIQDHEERKKDILSSFRKGLDIGEGDGIVRVKRVTYEDDGRFSIVLTEGKKRQIRRMFGVIGCRVTDLERVRVGRLKLGNLKEGESKNVAKSSIL